MADLTAYYLQQLRVDGWTVAAHYDYYLEGVPHTFWLFTKVYNGVLIAAKGEAKTDEVALREIRAKTLAVTKYLHGRGITAGTYRLPKDDL